MIYFVSHKSPRFSYFFLFFGMKFNKDAVLGGVCWPNAFPTPPRSLKIQWICTKHKDFAGSNFSHQIPNPRLKYTNSLNHSFPFSSTYSICAILAIRVSKFARCQPFSTLPNNGSFERLRYLHYCSIEEDGHNPFYSSFNSLQFFLFFLFFLLSTFSDCSKAVEDQTDGCWARIALFEP